MGRKLDGYVLAARSFMARHGDHYRRHPDEREAREQRLRALEALASEAAKALEEDTLPTTAQLSAAATAAGVPVGVVEEACAAFVWFFTRGGLRVANSDIGNEASGREASA